MLVGLGMKGVVGSQNAVQQIAQGQQPPSRLFQVVPEPLIGAWGPSKFLIPTYPTCKPQAWALVAPLPALFALQFAEIRDIHDWT